MNEPWEEIIAEMKAFARVENIQEIVLLGDKEGEQQGVRRITIGYLEDGGKA